MDRDNLNKAYKRVKANKGACGVDGMSVDEALPWLKGNGNALLEKIRSGKYKPSPVRRVEIPKDNGGKRQLGMPTVIDRIIQQAIAQVLIPIYEPKVNAEKSRAVSVYSIRNFGFSAFGGGNKDGAYIRVHAESQRKAKAKLKQLTSRSQGRSLDVVLHNTKVYMQGWLGYYGIAEMKNTIEDWNG